jgi:tetratricopeptide (TPR) repeat protein
MTPRLLPLLITALIFGATMAPAIASACDHDAASPTTQTTAPTLGALHFPTSTRVPAAQAAFERGLLWWHLFEYPHAAAEFQRAQQLDPGFALAYWGEAMTYTHALWNQDEPDAARAVLARLGPTPQARAARAADARERAWLDTAEQQFGPGTLAERDARFLAAATALADAYPDDDEAPLLHALALLGVSRGERDVANYLQGAAIARKVLARNPHHPGAAHYWIHGMDDPEHAAGALEAARALATIAPDAGHGQHMTAHIFMALGMWDEVVAANEAALRVTDAETQAAGLPPFPCGHYVEWLQYGYYQQGRVRDAQRLLDQCATVGANTVEWFRAHPEKPYRSMKTPAQLQQRWHESLVAMRGVAVVATPAGRAANAVLAIDTADLGRGAGWDAFARGYAAAEAGDLDGARRALAMLEATRAQPPGAHELPSTDGHLGVLVDLLTGLVAARDGHADDALVHYTAAGEHYTALPFDYGPPVPLKPPFELAGEALLVAGRPAEARDAFDRALALSPRRTDARLGRARALKALGDTEAARQAYAEIEAIWHGADADLPALEEVRAGAK